MFLMWLRRCFNDWCKKFSWN